MSPPPSPPPPPGGKGRRRQYAGLKDVLHSVSGRGLAAIGSRSAKQRLLDDPETVTLQVGKTVFDGAPRKMRTELYMSSLQRRGAGVAAAAAYEDLLLTPVSAEAASDIDKDLARTFPAMRRFAEQEGQEALRRVLHAYAAFDAEVGYCQGLNFVAGLLLMFLPERHAFAGVVVLMQDRGLRRYFSTDMGLLQTHLWQLGRLMPPKLCAHLEAIGCLPLMYAAPWLMTCFSSNFPASFAARVMDGIMSDRLQDVLLKVSVALLRRCEARLLAAHDMEQALQLLKAELPAFEEPILHDILTDAFSTPWTPRQLQLLGNVDGAESVAEALARVQRANTPTQGSADAAAASGAGSQDDVASPPGTAAALPSPAAVSGGGGGGGGPSSSTSGGGGGGGAAALPLFPPPPSPQRTSSMGSAGGVGGGVVSASLSQPTSWPASRASSRDGSAAPTPSPLPPSVQASPGHHVAAADSLAAAAAGAQHGAHHPHLHPHHHHNHHHSRLQPLAVTQQASDGHHHGHHQQQHHQQQQHADMIELSSPRAPAAGSSSSGWDPFGLHEPAEQQQQPLGQQLEALSLGSSRHDAVPAAPGHSQHRHHQQQQQHHHHHGPGGVDDADDDEWGDFVSPTSTAGGSTAG